MSPEQSYQIARAHQHELVNRAMNSHRIGASRTAGDGRRSIRHRLVQVMATLGVCVAAGSVVAVSDAQSNQRPIKQHAGHVSAQQLAREYRSLEAKGYVPTSCTVSGTLMRNYSTGQSLTVKL